MSRPADPSIRIELLRAAEAVFTQQGLSAAKVEDITARAGVSKGAFYLHFASKDDCFRQIAEAFIARLANCVEPPPTDPNEGLKSTEEQLAYWLSHDIEIFEFVWENRALVRMVLSSQNGPSFGYLVDELAERVRKNVEAWLTHGVEVGVYRKEIDRAVVASLMSGAYDRLARELVRRADKPDIAAWCEEALGLFTRGLLLPEERSKAAVAKLHVADRPVKITPSSDHERPARSIQVAPPRGKRGGSRPRSL